MQVLITNRLLNTFKETTWKNNFSWCTLWWVFFQANGEVGETNTKSNMLDPCDCNTAGDQEEWETREICPLDRGSWLRQSIVLTQHFWNVRSTCCTWVFLGWASLHCTLMQVCHCASVTVNLVSLAENSEAKKRPSSLLSGSLKWNYFKDLSFSISQFLCWHLRFMTSKIGSWAAQVVEGALFWRQKWFLTRHSTHCATPPLLLSWGSPGLEIGWSNHADVYHCWDGAGEYSRAGLQRGLSCLTFK